jgi:hypothetical protein
MGECCGCLMGPQGLLSLTAHSNLTSNWPGATPASGAIDIVSTAITDPYPPYGCSPSTAYTPSRELNGYVLHEHASIVEGSSRLSEVPIADAADLDPITQSSLVSTCANLTNNGHVCSCSAPE